jgi:multiple sugar transport system permease protein
MRTYESPFISAARYMLLIVGAFLTLAPFVYMLGTSFKPNAFVLEIPPQFFPAQPTIENYTRAITTGRFGRYFLNSLMGPTSPMRWIWRMSTNACGASMIGPSRKSLGANCASNGR